MPLSPLELKAIFPQVPKDIDLDALDTGAVPVHIAVIMDGNGRWAQQRGLSRSEGHKAGVKGVREVITTCNDLGVKYLTIYSFSTENWNRPKKEVAGLMTLFADTLMKELKGLCDNNVRLVLLGRPEDLPKKTREVFENGIDATKDDNGMTLAIAVNYGGRQEIGDAVRTLARRVEAGELAAKDIDDDMIASELYTAHFDVPDPDLLIRTSGESRVSNFLLWQIAYSEIYVTETLWPDFSRYELLRAIIDFQGRTRRFGGV